MCGGPWAFTRCQGEGQLRRKALTQHQNRRVPSANEIAHIRKETWKTHQETLFMLPRLDDTCQSLNTRRGGFTEDWHVGHETKTRLRVERRPHDSATRSGGSNPTAAGQGGGRTQADGNGQRRESQDRPPRRTGQRRGSRGRHRKPSVLRRLLCERGGRGQTLSAPHGRTRVMGRQTLTRHSRTGTPWSRGLGTGGGKQCADRRDLQAAFMNSPQNVRPHNLGRSWSSGDG